jgi:hypothetical protein
MAILRQQDTWNPADDLFIPGVQEFAIGGKLMSIKYEIAHTEAIANWDEATWKEHIRQKVVNALVEKIMQEKLVEITVSDNLLTQGKTIHARCYLAPNDQVKILRTLTKP